MEHIESSQQNAKFNYSNNNFKCEGSVQHLNSKDWRTVAKTKILPYAAYKSTLNLDIDAGKLLDRGSR